MKCRNAASYDALRLPHELWGKRTLARLPLAGDETVLELGCGTGRDTARLLERLPDGRVIALDGSSAMLNRTRATLWARQTPLHAPTRPACHPAVFADLARILQPSGWFVAEYGGAGNVASVTVVLGAQLAQLPSDAHDAFFAPVAARLPGGELDYVRCRSPAGGRG